MYKTHIFCMAISGILIFISSWLFKLPYHLIASDAIVFISIAIAVYMTALALPLGENMSKYMAKSDKNFSNKTHMNVFCTYIKMAIYSGFFCIIDSCAAKLIAGDGSLQIQYSFVYNIVSSMGFSLFGISMIFSLLIFKYMLSAILNGNNANR